MDSTLPKPAPSDPQPIVVELDPRTELQRMSITELVELEQYCYNHMGPNWSKRCVTINAEIAHRIDGSVKDE